MLEIRIVLWTTLTLVLAGSAVAAPAGATEVRMEVRGFDDARGVARCGLFVKDGWGKEEQRVAGADARIEKGRATCVFSGVTPGRYGVIVYHDANGNHQLDKNFLGIPTEAYCFSQEAEGGLGIPDFEDASFAVEGAVVVTRCGL